MMKHKGYCGVITYDYEAKILRGHVVGLNEPIAFEGNSVNEIECRFKQVVDEYINECEQRGENPEKAYSGNIRIRVKPELHAQLAYKAAVSGESLCGYITQKLKGKK